VGVRRSGGAGGGGREGGGTRGGGRGVAGGGEGGGRVQKRTRAGVVAMVVGTARRPVWSETQDQDCNRKF